MARTINAGDTKVTRKDSFGLDPEQIIFEIPTNARWHPKGEHPLNHESIVEKAREFLNPAIGQLQPIIVRQVENSRVRVVDGFHRLAAAIMVKNGSEEYGIAPHPDFKIECVVRNVNEQEGLRMAIRANLSRLGNSPMDNAENMRKLRGIGDDDKKIMATLGLKSIQSLKVFERLLSLPDDIKLKVHVGDIPQDVAARMADLSAADQGEVLQAATNSGAPQDTSQGDTSQGDSASALGSIPSVQKTLDSKALTGAVAASQDAGAGRINKKVLRKAVRNKQRDTGKKVSLNVAEIRIFISELSANAHPKLQQLASAMFKLIDGEMKNDEAEAVFLQAVAA